MNNGSLIFVELNMLSFMTRVYSHKNTLIIKYWKESLEQNARPNANVSNQI